MPVSLCPVNMHREVLKGITILINSIFNSYLYFNYC